MRAASRLPFLLTLVVLSCTVVACGPDGASTRDDSMVYVAIGASESVGTGARNPTSEGWVAVLHSKMPAGTRLANLGIGGISLHQALEQELPVAADLQPTVVTVWLDVNDLTSGVTLESYRADLDTLLATLARDTKARVYVANLPDLTLLPAFKSQPSGPLHDEIVRWNAAITTVVAARGAVLIDLYSGWSEIRSHPEYISRDGLHPTTAGHKRLAELFWQAMQDQFRAVASGE